MSKQAQANRLAWESHAYDFWVQYNGTPADAAARMVESPESLVSKFIAYLGDV